MPTVLRCSWEAILLALQARIMSVTGFPAERVVIDTENDDEDETHYQAEQVVFIRKANSSPNPGYQGMGRIWTTERVRLNAVLWTRCGLDEPPGAQIALTDPSLGHEPVANQIRNALYGFIPIDNNQNWLVQQPLEPGGTMGPKRRKKQDFTWLRSIVTVIVTYAPDLDQTYCTR